MAWRGNRPALSAAVSAKRRLAWAQQLRCCCNIPGMTRKTREREYERLVDLDKPYKKVMALKNLLLKEPENVFSFAELGKLRTHVGLTGKSRFIALISKYPTIFALFKDEASVLWCGFSPQAQKLADQELALIKSYESVAVQKLRKLLMMSVDRRIRVPKIAQLRRDLGFPADFQSRMIYAYPHYFTVKEEKYRNEEGPVLELACWDDSLASTSWESRAKAANEYNSAGEPMCKVCVSTAIRLSMKQKEGIQKFQERPFISPYTDSKDYSKNTLEFEKRQVALLHEILSMTLEKKTVLDFLTHFRKEFRLPHSVLALVVKHHYIFYASRKGGRITVFLKEGYEGGKLIEKNEFNLLKEQYVALMERRSLKKTEDTKDKDENECDVARENECDVAREKAALEEEEEQEDPDFDALISLCHKIQKESADDSPYAADSKSKMGDDRPERMMKGAVLLDDDEEQGVTDDLFSGLGELEEEESEHSPDTSDEDEGSMLKVGDRSG